MSDFVPIKIVREILLRLPVETLVRCTCVCKQWQSLITSSYFITTHLSRPPPLNSGGLLRYFNDDPKTQSFSLNFNSEISHNDLRINKKAIFFKSPFKTSGNLFFRIVGSLHGVVCLSDDVFGHTGNIILWNPSVKRFVLLPQPGVVFRDVGPFMFVLGFGFDSKRNDYKVVRLAYVLDIKGLDVLPPRVEIYSLKDGSWREINATGVFYSICEHGWRQCYVNGCVHWIAYEKKLGSIHNLILLFDLSEDKFKKMKLPESLIKVLPINLDIAEINSLLGVLAYCGKLCEVWIRKEYGVSKSWTKMYSVDLDDVGYKVLGLWGNGELLMSKKNGTLVSYDTCKTESFDLRIQGFPEAFHFEAYTQSLVLFDKESRSISYRGVKMVKNTKQSQRSTDPSLEKEEDPSSILVTDSQDRDDPSVSARRFVNMYMRNMLLYQLTKFGSLHTDENN